MLQRRPTKEREIQAFQEIQALRQEFIRRLKDEKDGYSLRVSETPAGDSPSRLHVFVHVRPFLSVPASLLAIPGPRSKRRPM